MRRGIVLVAVLVAGCGSGSSKSHRDAHNYTTDFSHVDVLAMPNDFGNVANKCDGHGHRVYVTTNTDSPSNLAVLDDKSCSR